MLTFFVRISGSVIESVWQTITNTLLTPSEKLVEVNLLLHDYINHEEEDGLTPELLASVKENLLSTEGIQVEFDQLNYTLAMVLLAVKKSVKLTSDILE